MYDHLVQTTVGPLLSAAPAARIQVTGRPRRGSQRRFVATAWGERPWSEKGLLLRTSRGHSAVVPVTGTNAFGRCRASTGLMRLLPAGQGERPEGGDDEDPAGDEEADAESLGQPLGGAGPAMRCRPGGRDGDQDSQVHGAAHLPRRREQARGQAGALGPDARRRGHGERQPGGAETGERERERHEYVD